MASASELKLHLDSAKARLDQVMKGGKWEEFDVVNQEVLRLERLFAASKGEEYAEPVEFPVKWDTGAPLPHVLMNDYRVFLSFYLREPDPNWDGSYVTVKDPTQNTVESLALVEFKDCVSTRMGSPNDEVFNGHPLEKRGLEGYSAQRVVNSKWIKELQQINSVHSRYDPTSWQNLNHYILWFHDSTFECVAESFKVETFRESMSQMLARMVNRLLERK